MQINSSIGLKNPFMAFVACLFMFQVAMPSTQAMAKSKATVFDNFDQIAVRCVLSTKQRYVQKMCNILVAAAKELAADSGINIKNLGIVSKYEITTETTKEAEAKPSLQLIFYIRGTRGKNVGTSVNIQAAVNYENAVEQNSTNQHPRQGLLVLWQTSAVAQGEKRKISKPVAGHMVKKLEKLFDMIAERN